jgi:polysaccharide deacetylase family protein (PEP-CTERM system associated)
MIHAFTVDLEDWYHGIPVSGETKAGAERRLHIGTERLLELLARHRTRATFFMLSPVVREHPALARRIADAGHEVGSHGLSHDLVYEMSPQRFREETRSSVRDIEDCVGQPVTSYRAAYFSVTRRSMWALEVLAQEGIRFDSSIFPVANWRYGIPDYHRRPVVVQTEHGPLAEFPISTRQLFGRNLPTTGGAYFRIYPYLLSRANIRASEREGVPVVFYLHPWELDPEHPKVAFSKKAMLTHYVNLRSTVPKLERLLNDHTFTTLGDVLKHAFPQLGS